MESILTDTLHALPLLMTRLTLASWETIFRRTLMMAQGKCSPREYRQMVSEKSDAMRLSAVALVTGRTPAAVLAPYLLRATANARRLRKL